MPDCYYSYHGNTCTVIHKRPLRVPKKDYNEIYITSKAPLCVYYRRAIQLLRWQMSRCSVLCSKKFMNDNRVNHKTGVMLNRSKLIADPKERDNTSCDASLVSSALSKRHISSEDQKCKGVVLCGSGKCITKTLYVLQDIYEYVKGLLLEGHSRFGPNGLQVSCAACTNKVQVNVEARSKHGIVEKPCADCDALTNAHIEQYVKSILKVNIVTGTVTCSDDVYTYSRKKELTPAFGKFEPLGSSDADVTVKQRERWISVIRIEINIASA